MSGVNRVLIKIFMKMNLPGTKIAKVGRLAPKPNITRGAVKIIKRKFKVPVAPRMRQPVAPRMRQYGDKGYKPSTGKGVGH